MQAGLAGVHGNVSSFGSANGISVVALADFGKPGVGGVDGSSGATGKSSSGGSASINNDEDEIEDDDLLALLEGDEDAERSPKNTDKSDMYGKNLKTAVARVHNSVSGSITARAQQLKRPLNKNSYTPQFYDVSLITSGNSVSMANYIETPNKYTYSQEKQNHVHLGSLDNSGNMRGQATLEGGTRTTHTYTKSKGSGNGVSLFASTGRFAKNATRVALDNVNNDGHISGQIRQISGNNSGYNSPHMMSGSEATGSGNGISLYSDTFNAQIPRVETRLGKINNRGSIRGDAYLKAGDGSGDLSIDARASGNGISVYQATGNAALTALGSVNNEGIIQGHIETRAGTVFSSAQRGQTIPEERARLIVSDDKTIADYYKPNPTPEKPAAAGNDNYGTFANFRADSDVRASGNGISVQYASGVGADMNSGASLGDITNSGVISGYSENYHGYARGYGRVFTLNSGAGITTDRKITSAITNSGIISGNHAAILAKGRVDDSQSIREPKLEPGYETGKIKNYGLMAGKMIAGSYRAGIGNLTSSQQNFDHFDSSAATNDPLENYGSKIYLKTGISRVAEYNAPTLRSDDYEHIDRIVNGAGGTHHINGQRYTIQNGTLDASGTDSEHHASGNLRNHIVNGAGVARGALVADGKLALSNSIVNGYANALYLGANSDVTLNRSTLNANGHKINRSIDPLAVRGDDSANRLTLSHSTVNGNINLGAGDDTLTIADNNVRINGQRVSLGAGNDTVNLGQPGRRACAGSEPITVHYTLEGAENLAVHQASRLTADAKVRTNTITLNQADLTYQIDNNDQHALYDAARASDVTLRGIGISHGITSDLTLGITASVGREKTNGSHDSRLKGNSHYIGAHAVKTLGDLSLTGGLAYSRSDLKGTRHITNGYDSQSHAARNKPSVISAYAESKYTLRLNDRLAWEPKAILAYNHLKTSSVNENGSGGLTIASRGMNTVDIGIGQDLTYSTKAGSGELRGKLSLDYTPAAKKTCKRALTAATAASPCAPTKTRIPCARDLPANTRPRKASSSAPASRTTCAKAKTTCKAPQRRGKILSLGTKPTSPAQRGRVGRANKTHRDRINLSPHQQPETSMKKTKILYLAALLGGCAANSGINQNTLARELISPLVKQQCHSQLNARQEWQLASALMGAEIKQQWENKICGCVSEEAPSQMSGEEMIQVINPATRSQAVTNVAVKTVSACFNRIMSR